MFRALPIFLILLFFICGKGLSQGCESELGFAFIDETRVVIYNLSSNYEEVDWELSGAEIEHLHDGAAVASFDAYPATACLTIYGSDGCESFSCIEVFPGSAEDLCQTMDCVWPGDANGDGVANHFDLLTMGRGFNAQGAPREIFPLPDEPMAWVPNMAEDWANEIDGTNLKHLDSDGDGHVTEADVAAIEMNYQPDLVYQTNQSASGPRVFVEFMDSVIQMDPSGETPTEVGIRVHLGSEDTPATNVQGIAFSLDYPGIIVTPGSPTLTYNDSSFFGPTEETLQIQYDNQPEGISRMDVALSTREGKFVGGFGTLFEGNFIVIADIAVGKGDVLIPFEVGISKVLLLDRDGNPVPVQVPAQTASVGLQLGSTTTSQRPDPKLNRQVRLFPNPSSSYAQLQWTDLQPRVIQVFDAFGKLVDQQTPLSNPLVLNTTSWSSGLYSVRIFAEEGVAVKRLMVKP
jgi:hypothetical protein